MSESILQREKECYVTGSRQQLDRHHVYPGTRRKASEEWGCWVWLRHDVHMEIHDRDGETLRRIQRECQEEFEKRWGHEKFMQVFGKSYLDRF